MNADASGPGWPLAPAGEEHHRELQPLGPVDGHDLHRVPGRAGPSPPPPDGTAHYSPTPRPPHLPPSVTACSTNTGGGGEEGAAMSTLKKTRHKNSEIGGSWRKMQLLPNEKTGKKNKRNCAYAPTRAMDAHPSSGSPHSPISHAATPRPTVVGWGRALGRLCVLHCVLSEANVLQELCQVREVTRRWHTRGLGTTPWRQPTEGGR